MLNRRSFVSSLGGASLAALWPLSANAAPVGRVIVVGGGMAGAAVAKYLRLWGGNAVAVTLVEQATRYTSNIMSNLVVTGQMSMSSLYFGYGTLTKKYGIKQVTGRVVGIEPGGLGGTWKLTVSTGGVLSTLYGERVVLAPGVQFDAVPETGQPTVPATILHAWEAGPQTEQLRQQLAAMQPGQTFVMTIPPKPYRCPPGPYERACVVADYLKRNKPGARVMVFDANAGITAEAESFGHAFDTLYGPSILEYHPSMRVASVDSASRTVTLLDAGNASHAVKADVLNVIPPHRAGAIVQTAGLANATSVPYAAVDVRSFESTQLPGIHVVGDSSRTTLPKAGHVGNQGGKICADAIIRAFNFQPPDPMPTANSACYSPVSSTLASWLTAVYQYDPATGSMVIRDQVTGSAAATEAKAASSDNFGKMGKWFKTLMSDTFA
ncbi:MAG: FCSD flavin-binding domain-containing protein [Gammaproteobacteria bacterium]|uniref:FAD/NAD(P)-binding oxidoreductase n=1 Tax=Azohydromonas sp. TaxID=1872666 RepID=UPI002C7F425D|nr:FAD/NAD(P)-binding oxidoreductase [Azohydromonas sp.]HMM87342.1 FAD/NAD(P)-binding oxidoreductase [Azohydromonas sp.]